MQGSVLDNLEYLKDIVEESSKVPITGKVVVDKREVLDIIQNIIDALPDSIKTSEWVLSERERILKEAKLEYDNAKKQTADLIKKQIENSDYVKQAEVMSQEIIASAQREAKAMRISARDYADEILSQVEKEVEFKTMEILNKIKSNVEDFAGDLSKDLNSTATNIRDNIKELRNIQ